MTGLPNGWRRLKLAAVCEVSPRDPALPADAPFVPMASVEVGHRFPVSYEDRGSRGGIRARGGDVLFARITPCLENGKVAQLPADAGPTGGSTEFLVIRPSAHVDPGYLYYWCLEPTIRAHAQSKMAGVTGRMRLTASELRPFEMPLPSLREQRRIVEVLEEHLSHLDAADASLDLARQRLESLVSSVVSSEITGEQTLLGDVADIQGGIQKQPKRAPAFNKFPFLRVANVTPSGLDLTDVHEIEIFVGELERYQLRQGDLLVVEGNGSPSQIGRAALWDGSIPNCVHQNHLIRVRAHHGLLPEYLELVWNSAANRRKLTSLSSSTSGLHTLSVSKLKSLTIQVPSIVVQHAVQARLETFIDQRHRLDLAVVSANKNSQRLRRSLLSAAFSGRLTGRSSDIDVVEELASA